MDGAQRVLVIQDASREVSSSAIKWALHGLSLKPGDMLTLLGVLYLINNPKEHKSRVDSSMFGANQKIVDREVSRKINEYENHVELKELTQLYETHKVELKIEVATGPLPKAVGLRIAQDLKATWIILDSRLTYDHKMIPGSPEEQELFSIEILPTSHPSVPMGQTEVIHVSQGEGLTQSSCTEEEMVEGWQPEEIFKNSICTICKNRRPNSGWIRDFTFEELQAATDGFSAKNTIYEGGIGIACRGKLRNYLKIAVKQHKSTSHPGEANFKSAVHRLKKARHENLGDFGVSTEHPSDDEDFETGHIAPEYKENRKLSTRTDVYAFGIVLLELITGRDAAKKKPGGKGLVEWVWPFLKDKRLLEIIDPRIANSHDSEQLYWIGRVTQKCLSKNPKKRLTMDKVVSALECIAKRKSCQVIQDLAAAKSYFYSKVECNGSRRYEKLFKRDSFSREQDNESRRSRSFSFNSASFSRSRSSTSSEISEKMWRERSGNRIPLHYAEMLD
ncbi:unnamed protein product [Dovyalis caffra]|uniref:Tyrosine-protein kinase catalytic domain-containing protein n=1 Tax=Dovyalis caffra TaxID=77055 RepID=A0AAV1RA63_9ROSI|nr:unnamed protein product [Dovyalis caffra]